MFSVRMLVALLIVGPPLQAQDAVRSDTTPFRRGQWAAQFAGGASFLSLGAIKFRSPTRALVLDLRITGSHTEGFRGDTLNTIESFAAIDLRIGRRSYRPVVDKVVALHTLGVQASFSHQVSSSPFVGRSIGNGWDGGPFGEMGATYLMTPHFGIGATGTVAITYSRFAGESFSGVKMRSWSLSGSTGVSFWATLFF